MNPDGSVMFVMYRMMGALMKKYIDLPSIVPNVPSLTCVSNVIKVIYTLFILIDFNQLVQASVIPKQMVHGGAMLVKNCQVEFQMKHVITVANVK